MTDNQDRLAHRRLALIGSASLLILGFAGTCRAAEPSGVEPISGDLVRCRHAAVVSVSPRATAVGAGVLALGGTAVDAAVATAFALAVTWPSAGNIGGGGYMLVAPPKPNGSAVVFDFRETAPAAATKEMFVPRDSRTAHRRVGVPGTVRGLALAHARFGKLPWKELVAPAIGLANQGFLIDGATADSLNEILRKTPKDFAEFHRTFGKPGGGSWRAGDRLIQPALASTLERIRDQGSDGFYAGETARLIAAEMQRGGGLITELDLVSYRPKVRDPVRGTYRDCEILSTPPSSSGGTTLLEMLNILENFDLRSSGRWAPETSHLIVEAMRRAYRDRACYLGDPDLNSLPARLTQKDYARHLASSVDRRHATSSTQIAGDIRVSTESDHTTQLSVIDTNRVAVSMTYTLENAYGSRVVVPGGGFLLNDEMNDFAWLPGVTNTSGRIGTPPNQIAPHKRMLSSMCPTILLRHGNVLLITGSPGGRTIINTVLGVVVNVVDFHMDLRAAVDAPRLHHQWLPDRVRVEPALAREHPKLVDALRGMGHRVEVETDTQGDAHSIEVDPATGDLIGVADKREDGSAAGF
jgi:gamma-glutamyltranspeptidase / glutathione hydrolase